MRNNVRDFLIQRLIRVKFIKAELHQLIEKSVSTNQAITYKTRLASKVSTSRASNKYNNISRQKIYCLFNASTKLTNKKFRLSRFGLNYLANRGKISGIIKRGW